VHIPPPSQKKSSQREDFDLGPIISKIILLKGGFPKGGIKNQPKKSST